MRPESSELVVYNFPCIVEITDSTKPRDGLHVSLLSATGMVQAQTWLLDANTSLPTQGTANVTLVEVPKAHTGFVMAACQFDPTLSLTSLIADSLCPIPDVVTQTKELIESIQFEPLRQVVLSALTQPGAALGYWRSPASLGDHHSYPGGLAYHSLEVATMVATSRGLPEGDRDVGIAFSLLHDYGKIWCYQDGKYTRAQKEGHVSVGFRKLWPSWTFFGTFRRKRRPSWESCSASLR